MEKDPSQIAADLAPILHGDVFADLMHRAAASIDASIYRILPQCVVVPQGIDDVVAVMRYAAEEAIPVAARGAGSGVAGESLCRGIVLDMTGRAGGDVEVIHEGERVACGPGVVLDDINRVLAPYGRTIGPDPSSGNRATLGGCVANNATGAHSLLYGHMADHVWALEGVLADGTVVPFHNGVRPDPGGTGRAQRLATRCLEILSQGAEVIQRAVPSAKRSRMGYQVAGVCHEGRVDMARLMAGSEGTLGVLTRVSLTTVPLPAAKGLLELEFDSLQAMAQAVPVIVRSGVSACELMDRILMDMALAALPQYHDLFPTDGAAVLMVEHVGADPRQVMEKLVLTDQAVGPLARGRRRVLDPVEQRRLWKSRKDAVPLLYRRRGPQQPVAFVEDTCVDPARLGAYLEGLDAVGRRHGVTLCYYGHAGDGELHVRPYLDLGDPEDVRRMRQIAEEVFSLVWSLGGSISGEHAYGLVRAGFVRRQFGDAYVEVLRQIKQAFDPQGIMNPGKVVHDDPQGMTRDLRRSRAFLPERLRSDLRFGPDELALEILQCNGCGLCRAVGADQRMCPVFQALGEELATPRAKANLLDLWATGQMDPSQFESAEFRRVLDLCVHCKACQQQCPSGVDVSKLILAAKAEYADRKGLRRTDRVLARNRLLGLLGTTFTPVANAALGSRAMGPILEKALGLDGQRRLPGFARGSFLRRGRNTLKRWGPVAAPVDRVVYLVDAYANTYDHAVGLAVLKVLRANQIEVVLPNQRPVPLPAITYGDTGRARRDMAYLVRTLAPWVRKGYPVVCSEPSAALALRDELKHYVAGPEAEQVAGHGVELMSYLWGLHGQGRLRAPAFRAQGEYAYHLPCHLMALTDGAPGVQLMTALSDVRVTELKAGCCGLAGTYGMQRAHRETSGRMARRLSEALAALEVPAVLTECSACRMQIEYLSGGRCTVRHPIQVLAAAYGDGLPGPRRSTSR